jgi:hypothetical protein
MELLRQGSRLSVQPVSEKHFEIVLNLANNSDATAATKAPTPPTHRLAQKSPKKPGKKRGVQKK